MERRGAVKDCVFDEKFSSTSNWRNICCQHVLNSGRLADWVEAIGCDVVDVVEMIEETDNCTWSLTKIEELKQARQKETERDRHKERDRFGQCAYCGVFCGEGLRADGQVSRWRGTHSGCGCCLASLQPLRGYITGRPCLGKKSSATDHRSRFAIKSDRGI